MCARGLVRLQPTLTQTTIDIVRDNVAATSPTRQLWVPRACPTISYNLQIWHHRENAKIARTSSTMLVYKEGVRRVFHDAFANADFLPGKQASPSQTEAYTMNMGWSPSQASSRPPRSHRQSAERQETRQSRWIFKKVSSHENSKIYEQHQLTSLLRFNTGSYHCAPDSTKQPHTSPPTALSITKEDCAWILTTSTVIHGT